MTTGFTLVEILISLAVFSVVASSLLTNSTQMISTTEKLRNKTVANWIAANEVNRMRLNLREDSDYPDEGTTVSDIRMMDIEWAVAIHVASTENRNMRRVTVEVSPRLDTDDGPPLTSFTGFIGQY